MLGAVRALKASGVTLVLITHRPQTLSLMDKVLVLQNGAVQRFGTRDEVLPSMTAGGPQRPQVAAPAAAPAVPSSPSLRLQSSPPAPAAAPRRDPVAPVQAPSAPPPPAARPAVAAGEPAPGYAMEVDAPEGMVERPGTGIAAAGVTGPGLAASPGRDEAATPRPIGGHGVVVRPPGPIRAQSTSLKVQNVQAISARPVDQG